MKSLEQRIFEAHQRGTGIRLTANELLDLVNLDDAILTRISNTAAIEAGADEPGDNCMRPAYSRETWSQFKKRLAD